MPPDIYIDVSEPSSRRQFGIAKLLISAFP